MVCEFCDKSAQEDNLCSNCLAFSIKVASFCDLTTEDTIEAFTDVHCRESFRSMWPRRATQRANIVRLIESTLTRLFG